MAQTPRSDRHDEQVKDLLVQAFDAAIEREEKLEVGPDFCFDGTPGWYVGTLNEDRDRNGVTQSDLVDALSAFIGDVRSGAF